MQMFFRTRKEKPKIRYKIKQVTDGVCHLTLYGLLDRDEAPPIIEQALAEIETAEWRELEVDVRWLKPLPGKIFQLDYVAILVRLMSLAMKKARANGVKASWFFRFGNRPQVEIVELCRLREILLVGHMNNERGLMRPGKIFPFPKSQASAQRSQTTSP